MLAYLSRLVVCLTPLHTSEKSLLKHSGKSVQATLRLLQLLLGSNLANSEPDPLRHNITLYSVKNQKESIIITVIKKTHTTKPTLFLLALSILQVPLFSTWSEHSNDCKEQRGFLKTFSHCYWIQPPKACLPFLCSWILHSPSNVRCLTVTLCSSSSSVRD